MTLSCERVFALLSEYLDGELPADVHAAFEAHIQGCSSCARFGKDFMEVVEGLRSAERPTMSEGLHKRLKALVK